MLVIKYTVLELLEEKKLHRANLLAFLFDPKGNLSKNEKEAIVDEIGRLNHEIAEIGKTPVSEMKNKISFPQREIKSKMN